MKDDQHVEKPQLTNAESNWFCPWSTASGCNHHGLSNSWYADNDHCHCLNIELRWPLSPSLDKIRMSHRGKSGNGANLFSRVFSEWLLMIGQYSLSTITMADCSLAISYSALPKCCMSLLTFSINDHRKKTSSGMSWWPSKVNSLDHKVNTESNSWIAFRCPHIYPFDTSCWSNQQISSLFWSSDQKRNGCTRIFFTAPGTKPPIAWTTKPLPPVPRLPVAPLLWFYCCYLYFHTNGRSSNW